MAPRSSRSADKMAPRSSRSAGSGRPRLLQGPRGAGVLTGQPVAQSSPSHGLLPGSMANAPL
eukprot:4711839-Amphidinium_carterae.1